MERISYAVPKARLGKPNGPNMVFDGNRLLVSYDRGSPLPSGGALDAMPAAMRRHARDADLEIPTSGQQRHPVQELLQLLQGTMEDADYRAAVDLLSEFVDLPTDIRAGDRVGAMDSASAMRQLRQDFAHYDRLKFA
jgi:hypothetical protein